MNNILANPNLYAWTTFLITTLCMWAVFLFWGPRLLGGFGQPDTKLFVRPLVALSWVGLMWLRARLYYSMLSAHHKGPDPFLSVMLPVEILVSLLLVLRAALSLRTG